MHGQRGQLGSASSPARLSGGDWESATARNARSSDGIEQWLGSMLAPRRSFLWIGHDCDRGGPHRATNSAGRSAGFCVPTVADLSRFGLDAIEDAGNRIFKRWYNWRFAGV